MGGRDNRLILEGEAREMGGGVTTVSQGREGYLTGKAANVRKSEKRVG